MTKAGNTSMSSPARPTARMAARAAVCITALLAFAILACPHAPAYADDAQGDSGSSAIQSLEDLAGKRLGTLVGTTCYDTAQEYCGANGEVLGFNAVGDLPQALEGNKIDAYIVDGPVAEFSAAQHSNFRILVGYLSLIQYAYMFPKSAGEDNVYLLQMNEFLTQLKASGELDEILDAWYREDESYQMPDYESLDGSAGTIRMATTTSVGEPLCFLKNGRYAGIDIDLVTRFCAAYGYQLEISDMDAAGAIASLEMGRSDIAGFGATVTEERKLSFNFSEPYYDGGVSAVVKTDAQEGAAFLESIAASLKQSFIDQDRWMIFADGAVTTLLISLLSIVLGTLLGFAIYLWIRGGGRIRTRIVDFCIWLISGMPAVVLLMVLFYIAFARVAVSGTFVSVVTFTLIFAAATIGMLRVGEGAVDDGQKEAARALGYSDWRAFIRIVLPQAVRHILPTYRSEAISLLKGTAVVGYIAVRDLTKAGDIVRSATYEAIVPLIAVAVVYFILEACIKLVVRMAERRLFNRSAQSGILKDVRLLQPGELLEINPESPTAKSVIGMVEKDGREVLRFEDMGKAFGGTVVLEHVNATVRAGDVVAIIGPSGCGKSTLMRTVNLLDPATSGKVLVNGCDISSPDFDSRRLCRSVGMVFQRWNLFGHWTIIENLMRPQMDLCGRSAQEAYEVGMKQLQTMGLTDKAYSYPSELSGGQQQRIAILRAFACGPDIVLMDEPTSALDPRMVGEVQEALVKLAELGKTMLIVSHDMKFSRTVCNRVFYMDEKGLYEEGTPEEIFDHPMRPKTRAFISQSECETLDITSREYDKNAVMSAIDAYFERMAADTLHAVHVRRAFEYFVGGLLVPSMAEPVQVRLFVVYSAEKGITAMVVRHNGEQCPGLAAACENADLAPWARSVEYRAAEEDGFTWVLDVLV